MQVLRRKNILHRALVAALCLGLAMAVAAQRTSRKSKGPRALALVEWPASGGSPRVIPVAILVDGRYYDASIYKADPVPMALEPGNVYEVEQSGESIGMATLTAARQAKNGAWLADARFQTNEQLAAARKPREAPKSANVREGPPTLRRGSRRSAPESAPQPPSTPEPTPRAGDPDEPPVLRKPPTPTPATQPPNEPTSTPKPSQASASAPKPDDSDHPVLRRGRPTAEQAENLPGAVDSKAAPKTAAARPGATSVAGKATAGAGRVLAAISDAAGPEPRSFALPWKGEEQEKLKASMVQLAGATLEEFARTHGGAHPGKLQEVQVRAFDLSTSNEPQLVLTARAVEAPTSALPARRTGARKGTTKPPAPASSSAGDLAFWITLAARQDYNGELRKLKVWATDSKHLDAYPRAELIDAVDADGNGRGELLFREISDVGQSFVLYRATPDTLTQLYNSAQLQQ